MSDQAVQEGPARLVRTTVMGEQVVTPWDVQGAVNDEGNSQAIDYGKLIVQFGTRPIDQSVLERFETLTGRKPHLLMRRGVFFSHRYTPSFFFYLASTTRLACC